MAPAVKPAALSTRAYSTVPTPRWAFVYVPRTTLASIQATTIHGPTDSAIVLTSLATGKSRHVEVPDCGERRRRHDDGDVTGRDAQLKQPLTSRPVRRPVFIHSRVQVQEDRSWLTHGLPHDSTNPPLAS